jgi:hypothetical protein
VRKGASIEKARKKQAATFKNKTQDETVPSHNKFTAFA